MATFEQEGRFLDYTPVADTPAGTEVVIGDLLGITPVEILANKLGSLDTEGVWTVTKAAGAATNDGVKAYRVIADGEWQEDPTDAVLHGYFVGDQLSADTECKVRLAP